MNKYQPNNFRNKLYNQFMLDYKYIERITDQLIKDSLSKEFEQLLEELEQESPEKIKKAERVINRKLFLIIICFVISNIVYALCETYSKFPKVEGELSNTDLSGFLKTLMVISAVISCLGIMAIIGHYCQLFKKISVKVKTIWFEVLTWLLIIPVCISISTFCFNFVFTMVLVDGSSMMPTISDSQELIIVNAQHHKRFDIVAIHVSPETYPGCLEDTLYLKRIIGLPGESLKYRFEDNRTVLYVRKAGESEYQRVEEYFYDSVTDSSYYNTYFRPNGYYDFDWDAFCENPLNKCIDDDGWVIPDGYYYVLGDNRWVSNDSRNIGLVKESDIVGTARYRIKGFLNFQKLN